MSRSSSNSMVSIYNARNNWFLWKGPGRYLTCWRIRPQQCRTDSVWWKYPVPTQPLGSASNTVLFVNQGALCMSSFVAELFLPLGPFCTWWSNTSTVREKRKWRLTALLVEHDFSAESPLVKAIYSSSNNPSGSWSALRVSGGWRLCLPKGILSGR